MSANEKDTKSEWIDPDEAPEWSDETFERAEVREGDKVLAPMAKTHHLSADDVRRRIPRSG